MWILNRNIYTLYELNCVISICGHPIGEYLVELISIYDRKRFEYIQTEKYDVIHSLNNGGRKRFVNISLQTSYTIPKFHWCYKLGDIHMGWSRSLKITSDYGIVNKNKFKFMLKIWL